jgi:hypothetical protein
MKVSNTVAIVMAIGLIGMAAWKWLDHAADLTPSNAADPMAAIAPANGGPMPEPVPGSEPVPDAASAGLAAAPAATTAGTPGAGSKRLYGSAFEGSLLTGGFINSRAMKLIEAPDFGRVVAQLDAQNAGQRHTLAEKYRPQIETSVAAYSKQAQIDRFACGLNVCLASIVDRQPGKWYREWYESVQSVASYPMGALYPFDVELPGGGIEHRILFTTLPESAGFMLDPVKR